jgi:uncharacterized protein (TIGR02231 family)
MFSIFRSGAFAAAVASACLVMPQARAADISATIPIDKVTVYRDSAIVTRAGTVEVPSGEHRLILRNLPGGLDPASLRLSARGQNVRLGGIEVQQVTQDDAVNDSERALNKKMRALDDQKVAIEDDIAAAQSQLKLLESVVAKPTGDGDNAARIDGASLNSLLGSVGTSDAAARTKIRNARLQLRDLDEQREVLKAELAKVATSRKSTTELRATVHADGDARVPVELEYQMAGAGWEWQYEARLDSQTKKVSLARQSDVRQGTGEDWKNIELTVSTSRPSMNTVTPRLAALFLDLRTPQYEGGTGDLDEIVVTGVRSGRSRRYTPTRVSSSPAAPPKITAEVFATDFVADYRIPGRVSVASDREARLYPIADDDLNVELVARANMAVAPTAYLEAKVVYQGEVPIDSGRVQLYRDDAFIGVAGLPLVLPGDEVRLPFGIDQRVRIVVRDEREESGERGVINKQQLDQHKRRFEVTSFHAITLPIEIVDRVPVPRDGDIRVEVLEGATPPTQKDVNGLQGVYLWRLPGTPQKTETIRHYYAVKFPKDKELAPSESR